MKILVSCNHFLPCRIWPGLIASLALIAVTGCNRDEIKVYTVAKELPAANAAPHTHSDAPASVAPPTVTWKTPEGWEEVAPGEMRLASFKVKGPDGLGDVSIVPLPGLAGGDAPNVNRWRSQVGLPPAEPEELEKTAGTIEIGGQPAKFYELAGTNTSSGDASRVFGVIQHREGTAWFYKMTGDDAVVARNKTAFLEFLKSINFSAAAPALPPDHPPIGGAASSSQGGPSAGANQISNDGKPAWIVPAGWTEIPGGQFLVAKFTIGDGDAKAAVNVSSSTGDGGGLAGNVNRWRQQLGLATLSPAELAGAVKVLDVMGGKASLVEMEGKDARSGQPARVVGAIVPREGQTWFYKLMGDTKLVEAQQEAFTKFVQGVKY